MFRAAIPAAAVGVAESGARLRQGARLACGQRWRTSWSDDGAAAGCGPQTPAGAAGAFFCDP